MYESKVVTNTFGNAYKGLCPGLPLLSNKNLIHVSDPFSMKKKTTDHPNSITNKFPNAIILEKILYNHIYQN